MKLQKVSQSTSSFAGISFVHEEFNKCGLLQLIDEQPGKRNASGYGHGELFRTWFEIFFCGGELLFSRLNRCSIFISNLKMV